MVINPILTIVSLLIRFLDNIFYQEIICSTNTNVLLSNHGYGTVLSLQHLIAATLKMSSLKE